MSWMVVCACGGGGGVGKATRWLVKRLMKSEKRDVAGKRNRKERDGWDGS